MFTDFDWVLDKLNIFFQDNLDFTYLIVSEDFNFKKRLKDFCDEMGVKILPDTDPVYILFGRMSDYIRLEHTINVVDHTINFLEPTVLVSQYITDLCKKQGFSHTNYMYSDYKNEVR